MVHKRRLVQIAFMVGLVAVTSFGPPAGAAPKSPKPKIHPTTAVFQSAGISDDGRGAYLDGVDGVSSYRVEGSSSTNGWAFDLKSRRSTEPRTLTYDLTNPAVGPALSGIQVNDTHGQVYDLSDMAVGEVKSVRAAFHLFIDRQEYVLRFGQTVGDGSDPLKVTRVSSDEFQVETNGSFDLARYLKGNGPGEVLIGIYHVPVSLTLTNQ